MRVGAPGLILDLSLWALYPKKSWTPFPAKTLSDSSAKTAFTVSNATLDPAMTPSTTHVVPNTFPNAGHSISLISSATPLHKSASFPVSPLSFIVFLISDPSSDSLAVFGSAGGLSTVSGSSEGPSWRPCSMALVDIVRRWKTEWLITAALALICAEVFSWDVIFPSLVEGDDDDTGNCIEERWSAMAVLRCVRGGERERNDKLWELICHGNRNCGILLLGLLGHHFTEKKIILGLS